MKVTTRWGYNSDRPKGTKLSCIVNQQRERSQALFDCGHNLGCGLWVGHVGSDSNHLICRGAELCRSFVELGCQDIDNGDALAAGLSPSHPNP